MNCGCSLLIRMVLLLVARRILILHKGVCLRTEYQQYFSSRPFLFGSSFEALRGNLHSCLIQITRSVSAITDLFTRKS